jgi:hypothetical protein
MLLDRPSLLVLVARREQASGLADKKSLPASSGERIREEE